MKEYTKQELKELEIKAKDYDLITSKLANFYSDENIDNDNIDLGTIGEWLCIHFSYL